MEYQDGGLSAFPIHKQTFLFQGNLQKVKTLVKSLLLRSQKTQDLEYQGSGDELQNLITDIIEMRDSTGLFISVNQLTSVQGSAQSPIQSNQGPN